MSLGPGRNLTPEPANGHEIQTDPRELTVTRAAGHEVCWAQQQFAVQNKECVGDPVGAGPELTSELYD